MRALTAIPRVLAGGALVAMFAGCDLATHAPDPSSSSGDWESTIDLESSYGGYEMTDESAAFGDPEVLKVESLESASQPDVSDVDSIPADSVYTVRLLWGQLEGNIDALSAIDWTGSVSINQGHMGLRTTIAFEYPTDYVVRPRVSPLTIEFVSRTQPHYDGLLLMVHLVPSDVPATFSFTTGPYANTWTLEELLDANLVIPVDTEGNAVSINAVPARRLDCPGGFARGAWRHGNDSRGQFRGMWMSPLGDPVGYMRGHCGVNQAGQRVWFGKIIDPRGRVLGLARGGWEPSEDPGVPGGRFSGQFMTRNGNGEIAGRFMHGREDNPNGFFEARWQMHNCGGGAGDGGPGDGQPDDPPPAGPQ